MALFDLTGKKAVVTGASRGIGQACAQGLAEQGAEVFLIARDNQKLLQVQEEIISRGGKAETASLELTDYSALKKFFEENDLQDYSIWLNSAGANRPAPLSEVNEADYDLVMNVNVKSAIFQTQHFVNAVQGLQPASIIHISSQMGHVGGFDRTVYCASKHALEGFCKAAAWELGRSGIRVNTISPTFMETDMTRKTMEDEGKMKLIRESIALSRIGQVDDVVGAVIYLASDASEMVTGTSVRVDGGWTAR